VFGEAGPKRLKSREGFQPRPGEQKLVNVGKPTMVSVHDLAKPRGFTGECAPETG
jgi:hypothetical protein